MRQAHISHRWLGGGLLALAAVTAACTGATTADLTAPDTQAPDAADPEGTGTATRPDSGRDPAVPDAGPTGICKTTRSYFENCGNNAELTCGAAGFDAWCAQNDTLNSAAFRHAEEKCLTTVNCDGAKRRECDYSLYASEKQTAAEKALVKAYCEQCEPNDVSGCTKRSTTYDPAQGIKAVPDIFVAAWELADTLVDEIRTKCTAKAGDRPNDNPAACAKAFASCAGGVYLDRVPECSN